MEAEGHPQTPGKGALPLCTPRWVALAKRSLPVICGRLLALAFNPLAPKIPLSPPLPKGDSREFKLETLQTPGRNKPLVPYWRIGVGA